VSPAQPAPAPTVPGPGPEPAATATLEAPVVHPGAGPEAVRPVEDLPPVAPTGPVDLPPVPPPAGATTATPGRRVRARRGPLRHLPLPRLGSRPGSRRPGSRHLPTAALAGPALATVSVVLLELGLAVHVAGRSLWSRTPLWAGFATLAAVVGLAAFAPALPGLRRLGAERAWTVAAGGLCGLAVFWLLVVLPAADTDRGFLLTAALACLGAALWTAPGRGQPGRPAAAAPAAADGTPGTQQG
jgi:hypothetical protein